MTVQLNLDGGETVLGLTPRQQAVLDLVLAHAATEADEAGALAHSMKTGRWAHSPDKRCDYCTTEGRQILNALARKGLVKRRRAPGRYVYAPANPVVKEPEIRDGFDAHGFPKGF